MLDGRTATEIGINGGRSRRAFSGCRRASGSRAEARFLSQAKGALRTFNIEKGNNDKGFSR